jgi:aryl-alcohol dehydrogenase-like predicted oxidoreductase
MSAAVAAVSNAFGAATNGAIGNKLPTRKLGRNGPHVTALGWGLMGLSAFYGEPKPDAERYAILDAAYARGELFWDSADMYGDNEDLLGRSIFPSRVHKR